MDVALEQLKTAFMHSVNLARNRNKFARDGIRLFHDIERKYEDRFLAAISRLSLKDLERLASAKFTGSESLERFSKLIEEMTSELSLSLTGYSHERLRDLVLYETMFWKDRFTALSETEELEPLNLEITEPDRRVTNGIPGSMVVLGITVAKSFANYRRARRARLRQTITQNAARGKDELIRVFNVSGAARTRGRVIGESLAATRTWLENIHLRAASEAQKRFVDDNKALEMIYTAQTEPGKPGVDGRTTAICLGLNGKPVGEPESEGGTGGRIPPQHRGCRSDIYPNINYKSLSRRQKKSLTKETSMALKAGLPIGKTQTENFNQLSDAEKKQLIGVNGFKLWQQGKVKFPSGFINSRDERFYTLEEIAKREGIDISELRNST